MEICVFLTQHSVVEQANEIVFELLWTGSAGSAPAPHVLLNQAQFALALCGSLH